jgi:hypothetical protein
MTSLILPDAPAPDPTTYRHALDLRQSHAAYRRGDVLVWITWLRTSGEACIVLTPRRTPISHERIVPCIVPLSRAWAWAEETGDLRDVMTSAGLFCANLGFNPLNPNNVRKVIGIVRDHLGDLLSCPPMPTGERRVVADMTIINRDSGRVLEREVRDDG